MVNSWIGSSNRFLHIAIGLAAALTRTHRQGLIRAHEPLDGYPERSLPFGCPLVSNVDQGASIRCRRALEHFPFTVNDQA